MIKDNFNYFITDLEAKLKKAGLQKNPALWLYKNNARTTLFMLEGLAKICSSIYDDKYFVKLKDQLKTLEDTIGSIDYYDAFTKSFSQNKKITPNIVSYLDAQAREKTQQLNEILLEKKWLGAAGNRVEKIKKKLFTIKWEKEKVELKLIQKFYGKSVYEIADFVTGMNFHFDNVEADVHELRRKLRWLSIYPQATGGSIQLSTNTKAPNYIKKYLTKDIVHSPFNKMPEAGDNKHFLLLSQGHFLALSWMIATLGNLKDSGLAVVAIAEALQHEGKTETQAYNSAYSMLGKKQVPLSAILKEAEAICKRYFFEQNLEHLVIGIASTK